MRFWAVGGGLRQSMPIRIEICSNMSYELDQSITGSYFALNFLSKERRIFDFVQSNHVMQ